MNVYYAKTKDGNLIHGYQCIVCGKEHDEIDNTKSKQVCSNCGTVNKFIIIKEEK